MIAAAPPAPNDRTANNAGAGGGYMGARTHPLNVVGLRAVCGPRRVACGPRNLGVV